MGESKSPALPLGDGALSLFFLSYIIKSPYWSPYDFKFNRNYVCFQKDCYTILTELSYCVKKKGYLL